MALLTLAKPLTAVAGDGAASIAAGGIVPRHETRIVMPREVLRTGGEKLVVDFRVLARIGYSAFTSRDSLTNPAEAGESLGK